MQQEIERLVLRICVAQDERAKMRSRLGFQAVAKSPAEQLRRAIEEIEAAIRSWRAELAAIVPERRAAGCRG